MPRTRLIRPAFFKHGELYDAEQAAGLPLRVAYAGLWTVADRGGRFVWKPRDLKPDILPHDPVDFAAVLDALERGGFLRRYVVDGKAYGVIPSFGEHQTFHRTEPGSKLPDPPPLDPRETPVVSTANAVAVAVTGTGKETVVVGPQIVRDAEQEPADYALQVTITANRAVTAKWGEQTRPYLHGQSYELTTALQDAGVPLDVAQASIREQVESSRRTAPPGGINYFRAGILNHHATLTQKALDASAPATEGAGDALERWMKQEKAKEKTA